MNTNKAGQTHDQLQAACYRWACQTYHPYVYRRLICVPNDGIGAGIAKWKQYEALGVTAGVWDMPFFWVNLYKEQIVPWNFWWEFKVGTDRLRKGQDKFQQQLEKFGNTFFIASEEHEFKEQFMGIVDPILLIYKTIFDDGISHIERKAV